MSGWIIAIRVTPIGNGALERAGTLTDGRYRVATEVPSWDTSSVYKPGLADYPSEIGSDVDWQTGVCSIGGLDVKLLATDDILGWFCRPDPVRLTTLNTAINSTATTVVVDGNLAEDDSITIGREAIVLGTESGAGPYTYASSLRGALGTRAYAHGVDALDDIEVFDAESSTLYDLPMELIRVPRDGGYSDETVLWSGVVRSVTWDRGFVSISADSAFEILSRTEICADLWQSTSTAVFGFENADGTEPVGKSVTSAFDVETEVILSDGKITWLGTVYKLSATSTVTFVELQPAPDRTYLPFAGASSLHPRDEDGNLSPAPDQCWQMFSTDPRAPVVNASDDRLATNAVTLTLQLLTTSPDGGNGSYDLGVATLGGNIPASLVDVSGMEQLAEDLSGFCELPALHLAMDGNPIKLLDFIRERVLRPFGLVLVVGAENKLTVRRWLSGATNATAIGEADLTEPPSVVWRAVPSVDQVVVQYNERATGTDTARFTDVYNRERSIAGSLTTIEIQGHGVNEYALAEEIGVTLATRYHFPIPEISIVAKRSINATLGDVVQLTHSVVPGRGGSRGLSAEFCIVVAREESLREGVIRYRLWWISAVINRSGRIAPSARVVSYSAPTLTVEANAYLPSGSSRVIDGTSYTTDAGIWQGLIDIAGTVSVRILDDDLSNRGTASVTAASGAGNTLTLSSPTVTPVAGDVIVLQPYDSVGTEEQERYTYLADTDGTIGSGNADTYEWGD